MVFFADVIHDLDKMTFIYELDLYPLKITLQTKNKVSMSRLVKVIVLHAYIHRYRHIHKYRCTLLKPRLFVTNKNQ